MIALPWVIAAFAVAIALLCAWFAWDAGRYDKKLIDSQDRCIDAYKDYIGSLKGVIDAQNNLLTFYGAKH
jgi:hypothetical protein